MFRLGSVVFWLFFGLVLEVLGLFDCFGSATAALGLCFSTVNNSEVTSSSENLMSSHTVHHSHIHACSRATTATGNALDSGIFELHCSGLYPYAVYVSEHSGDRGLAISVNALTVVLWTG